jgi:hypothetical protein
VRGNSKKLLLIVLLTALVFVGLAGYGNFREVGQLLADFPPLYLLAALGLAALNYLLRFFALGLLLARPWNRRASSGQRAGIPVRPGDDGYSRQVG